MWSWLGYRAAAPMPDGTLPLLSRLAISKADGVHAWETWGHMCTDGGRTEGAAIVVILLVLLMFAALVTGLVIWGLSRLFRGPR